MQITVASFCVLLYSEDMPKLLLKAPLFFHPLRCDVVEFGPETG
jgi:hypothetical protein